MAVLKSNLLSCYLVASLGAVSKRAVPYINHSGRRRLTRTFSLESAGLERLPLRDGLRCTTTGDRPEKEDPKEPGSPRPESPSLDLELIVKLSFEADRSEQDERERQGGPARPSRTSQTAPLRTEILLLLRTFRCSRESPKP